MFAPAVAFVLLSAVAPPLAAVARAEKLVVASGGELSGRGKWYGEVTLSGPNVTDAAVAALVPLAKLYPRVRVYEAPQVTDAGAAKLAAAVGLTKLDIARCQKLTDAGVAALAGRHPDLGVLILSETKFTDAGVPALARLPRLSALNLRGTAVTDAGLAGLHGIKGLGPVILSDIKGVTNEGVAALKKALPKATVLQ